MPWRSCDVTAMLYNQSTRIYFGLLCSRVLVISHYSDVIMSIMASQIISIQTVCSAVCSGPHQMKHQSSAIPACVRGIHRSPVDSPHKGPVTRKMLPFDDVIMVDSRQLPIHRKWWGICNNWIVKTDRRQTTTKTPQNINRAQHYSETSPSSSFWICSTVLVSDCDINSYKNTENR